MVQDRKKMEIEDEEQQEIPVYGGEKRNGRLSQVKNSSVRNGDIPNEYISRKD